MANATAQRRKTTTSRGAARKDTPARVAYVQPPITLALVLAREEAGYRVRVGVSEALFELDAAVDPALIDEAIATKARVIVDPSTNSICGVLMTRRALHIDRDGDVRADVRRLEISTAEGALLKTPRSFLQLDDERLELFARETVVRARDAFRALAQLIKLN